MKIISIETITHGRALIKETAVKHSAAHVLVGFHGYAQSAEDMLSELEQISGSERWTLVSVQALHRFYSRRHERVVASWMTRQDREQAIADNIVYVNRVLGPILNAASDARVVFVGFSQGVAMAYRAAVLGSYRAQYLIAIGGDVPPDVGTAPPDNFPAVLIAAGDNDAWYTSEKISADEIFLHSHGARLEIFRYSGGHEWTAELRNRLNQILEELEH